MKDKPPVEEVTAKSKMSLKLCAHIWSHQAFVCGVSAFQAEKQNMNS